MRVLLTGATGMVGREVGKKLVLAGHQVVVLSRSADRVKAEVPFPCEIIEGDLTKEPLKSKGFETIEAVVHLAGESVAESRWSDEKKKKIYQSRALYTKHLVDSLLDAKAPLRVLVSTSAIGYYGDRKEEVLTEDSNQGTGFLADVCRDWERPLELVQKRKAFPQCRIVVLRVGVVLSPFAGALLKMIPAFRLGLGGAVGDGQQWMGWIHLADLANLYLEALTSKSLQGVINAVAPEPVTNLEFSRTLAQAFGKKLGPAVPGIILKTVFGEMSEIMLGSQRVEPQVLNHSGFVYKYPKIKLALEQVVQFYQNGESLFYNEQYLPSRRDSVFRFFADAKNLEKITPPELRFQILKMSTAQVQEGSLIDYRLKIHGIPVGWQTEILNWQPSVRFTDEQRKGPFKKWHHTHEFSDLGAGTLMTDLVRYKMPVGVLGSLVAGSFVAGDVRTIFSYRRQRCMDQKFILPGSS